MSRGELVHQLAKAGMRGDREALQRTMDALVIEARAQQQHGLAGRLEAAAAMAGTEAARRTLRRKRPFLPDDVAQLVHEAPARRRLRDLVLSRRVVSEVQQFLREQQNMDLLRANSLEPRHKILLVGPPGNGKTSLAEALALELGLPFLAVRYDAVVDSYLGETSSRIRRIVDFASANPCLLFFDEFDALAKERGDAQETGEIKRVVSSLLVQLDAVPSNTVIVCATNHPELLDRAVWRRFEARLELPLPGQEELTEWFQRFRRSLGEPAGITASEFVRQMQGRSLSEVEGFTLDVRRRIVLSMGALSAGEAIREELDRWSSRLEPSSYGIEDHGPELSNRQACSGTKDINEVPRTEAKIPSEGRARKTGRTPRPKV